MRGRARGGGGGTTRTTDPLAERAAPRAAPYMAARAAAARGAGQRHMAASTPFRDALSGGVGSVFCVYAGIPFDTVR